MADFACIAMPTIEEWISVSPEAAWPGCLVAFGSVQPGARTQNRTQREGIRGTAEVVSERRRERATDDEADDECVFDALDLEF